MSDVLLDVFRRMGRRENNKEHYVLEDVFDVLLGVFGLEQAADIVANAGNANCAYRFALHCQERLTPKMKEKLALSVILSKDFPASWAFFRTVEGLSARTRERLLENVPDMDEAKRIQYLTEPAIWGYDPG